MVDLWGKVSDFLVGEGNRGVLEKSAGQAAAAVTIPLVATSGLIGTAIKAAAPAVGAAAKSASSTVGKYIVANPIKSAVVGLVGGSAIVENPKLITQVPAKTASGLSNVGTNIGKFTKDPTIKTGTTIFAENPLIAGGLTAAGLGFSAAAVAPLISSVSQTSAIKEQTAAYKEYTAGLEQAAAGFTQGAQSIIPTNSYMQTSQASVPAMTAQPSYQDTALSNAGYVVGGSTPTKRAVVKRKKSQNLNMRPINIRNNILIANKNG